MPQPMPDSFPIIEYEILQVLSRLAQEKRGECAPSVVYLFEEEPLKHWDKRIVTHILAKARLPSNWRHELSQLGRVVFIP